MLVNVSSVHVAARSGGGEIIFTGNNLSCNFPHLPKTTSQREKNKHHSHAAISHLGLSQLGLLCQWMRCVSFLIGAL